MSTNVKGRLTPDGAVVKRGRRNEARWEEILTAAGELFAEKGYMPTTIEDIASRVGILPGSLYYYIAAKEDLLHELAVLHADRMERHILEDPATAHADAPTRLAHFIQHWMAELRSTTPWGIYDVIARDIHCLPPARLESFRQRNARLQASIRSTLHDIIQQGVADGDFDPTINLAVGVGAIFEMLRGTTRWYQPDSGDPFEAVTAWYQRVLIKGLSASESARAHSASATGQGGDSD